MNPAVQKSHTTDEFLIASKILIVDSNFTYRVALRQTLLSFGVLAENISLAKNLADAQAIFKKGKVDIIFSDFLFEDGIGTQLIRDKNDAIFILVSSETTQAAVANAAEMEVDQFIFKPYSQIHLKEVLSEVILAKINPSENDQYLTSGKEHLSAGEFEKAAILFNQAKANPAARASACSYLAEVRKMQNDVDEALATFRDGLAVTEIHFRCLNGLFHSLLNHGRTDDAYLVLKELLIHFPECPNRLSHALCLAVSTKNFVDVEEMFVVFKLMYRKTPELVKHMTSALLVNGHYHLKHKNENAALESFVRGANLRKDHAAFTLYIKEKLSNFGMSNRVDEVLEESQGKAA